MKRTNSHPDRHAAATRSTLVSVVVNFVLSVAQIAIGLFSNAQSLIADGFHSLSDLLADFIVLGANKISRTAADDNHPYGHARFETAASMFLGALLIIAGIGMLWVAAIKFINPASIPRVHVIALWTALTVIVSKELLFRYMLVIAQRVNSSMLVANAWHARADAASSLVVALGISGNLLGYTFLDPLAASIVGFMICRTGAKFAWEAVAQLTDRGLSPEQTQAIHTTFLETPGVRNVHDLRTRYMGDDVLIDAHILVDGRVSISEGHFIAANARRRVLLAHPALDVLVHVDPEDDSSGEVFAELPLRDEIHARFEKALGDGFPAPKPVLLIHYSGRTLDLDVFVSPALIAHENALPLLRDALAELRRTTPALRHVHLWQDISDIETSGSIPRENH